MSRFVEQRIDTHRELGKQTLVAFAAADRGKQPHPFSILVIARASPPRVADEHVQRHLVFISDADAVRLAARFA
jgi:hypothetical protein